MSFEAEHTALKLAATRRSLRCCLLALLLLAPLSAPAAEAPTLLTAYLSEAVSMTEAMVKACTSQHPGLTARGTAAFESWRKRNAADARRAAALVARELKALPGSREAAERALVQLRQEHLEGWQRVAAFATACDDYLASLERPESDLARFLPRS